MAPLNYDSRVVITGAQGIGKTAALVGREGPGALHRMAGLVAAMYLPTIDKAQEAADDYLRNAPPGSPPAMLIRGRSAPDPNSSDSMTMCHIPIAAERAAARGETVRSGLCEKCPHFDACGHIAQEKELKEKAASAAGLIIFATHAFLAIPFPANVSPDVRICDESPISIAHETIELTSPDFECDLHIPEITGKFKNVAAQADAEAQRLQSLEDVDMTIKPAVRAIGKALFHDEAEYIGDMSILRDRGIVPESFANAIQALKKLTPMTAADALYKLKQRRPDMTAADMDDVLAGMLAAENAGDGSAGLSLVHRLIALLEAVALELQSDSDHGIGVRLEPKNGVQTVRVHRAKPMLGMNKPLLILDGTASPELTPAQFGHLAFKQFTAPRRARVTQCLGRSFSTSSIVGSKGGNPIDEQKLRADLVQFIESHHGPTTLVACALGVEQKLIQTAIERGELTCSVAHFAALRGKNEWERYKTVIVIGRSVPTAIVLEDSVRGFAAIRGNQIRSLEDPHLKRIERSITDTQGRVHRFQDCESHIDPMVEAKREQGCEAEIFQAADRVRPIFADKEREIILLNNMPTITPDRVLTWPQILRGGSLPEQVLNAVGFVPLSGTEAYRLGTGIKGCLDTFKKGYLDLSKDPDEASFQLYHYTRSLFAHVKYKRKVHKSGANPNWQSALVKVAELAAARQIVERVTGPLADFNDGTERSEKLTSKTDCALVKHGFMPSSGREARRLMPEIFGSLHAAKKEVKRLVEKPAGWAAFLLYNNREQNSSDLSKPQPIFSATYRVAKTGTAQPRVQKAIAIGDTPEKVRENIELLAGPLAMFKAIIQETPEERAQRESDDAEFDMIILEIQDPALAMARKSFPEASPDVQRQLGDALKPIVRMQERFAQIAANINEPMRKLQNRQNSMAGISQTFASFAEVHSRIAAEIVNRRTGTAPDSDADSEIAA